MDHIIELNDEKATVNLARRLAALARTGDIIALEGDLGCGKTVFARAFIQSICSSDTEVPSPTFTLVQTYEQQDVLVYHFDLYRLEVPEEAFELGIDDAFADGISLIEWPDRITEYLPVTALRIKLSYGDAPENRRVHFFATDEWTHRLKKADFDG